MKKNIALLFLITSFQATKPFNALATASAIATWIVVSPIAASCFVHVHTAPNPVRCARECLFRCNFTQYNTLGGIAGGTIGTLAAVCVYNLVSKR